jgi:hypothetical protein
MLQGGGARQRRDDAPMQERITAQQLIDTLPIVAHLPWRVVARHIRYDTDDHGASVCPACAVAEELGGKRHTDKVTEALADIGVELSARDERTFIEAADDPDHPLHAEMLHALRIGT